VGAGATDVFTFNVVVSASATAPNTVTLSMTFAR